MNYLENQSLRLDQLRTGVANLTHAQQEASSLRVAREGLVTNFLSSVFTRASVALTDFVTAIYPKPDTALMASFADTKAQELGMVDYAKLRKAQLSTMEGFIGKYLPYGKVVSASLNYENDILTPQIKQFTTLLGGIINNHEDRKVLTTLEGKYKEQRKTLDGFDSEMSVFWQRGSFRSIQPAGDVIDRSSDLIEINQDAKAIADKLKQVNFQNIQAKVSEVRDLIKIAVDAIDNGGLKEISDAQLKNLSYGVLALAESVEFFGIVLYRANVYLSAIARLNALVKKIG